MQREGRDDDPRARRPYPWARALLILVLYGSLLIFLWYFPTSGVRDVFRNLLRGFGYLLLGLVLIGVTFVALLLIPPPAATRGVGSEPAESEDKAAECVLPGRALQVPALRDPAQLERVCQILEGMESGYAFVGDIEAGVLMVMGATLEDADALLDGVKARLQVDHIEAHDLSERRGQRARLP